ncbi:hypothetical protein D3C71_2022560 [compost metagenome]
MEQPGGHGLQGFLPMFGELKGGLVEGLALLHQLLQLIPAGGRHQLAAVLYIIGQIRRLIILMELFDFGQHIQGQVQPVQSG